LLVTSLASTLPRFTPSLWEEKERKLVGFTGKDGWSKGFSTNVLNMSPTWRTSATYNAIGKNCTNLDLFGNSEEVYKRLIQNIL